MTGFFKKLANKSDNEFNPVNFNKGLGQDAVLVIKPEHIHKVLTDKDFSKFPDTSLTNKMNEILGFIIVTRPDRHKELRPRYVKLLNGNSMKDYGKIMNQVLNRLLIKWKADKYSGRYKILCIR